MKVNILIQTLRQHRQPRSIPTPKTQRELDQEGLYYKDVAGFIIFVVITFVFLMIAMHN
jgi:hypothetical protein